MNTVVDERVAVNDRLGSRWLLAIPALAYALLVFPFVFRDVVGEPDLERMAMALVYGASSGLNEMAGYHYGHTVSFGYYAAFYSLLPRALLLNGASVISAINFFGFVSAVSAVAALGLYLARLYGVLAACIACIVFAFSPVYLDLGTSGHPQLPALALVSMGAWLLTYVTDEDVGLRGRWVLAGCVLVAMTAALTMRADEALAFPFIVLAGRAIEFGARGRWVEASALRLAPLVLACAAFLVLQAMSYHDQGAAQKGGFVADFFATFYKLQTIPRGLLVSVLCMGMASTIALIALLFTPALRQINRVHLAALLLLAVPTLLFWLPNSTPGRHMLFAYLAAAILIGLLVSRSVRAPAAMAIAVLLAVANQALAEASHGFIDRHYSWMYPAVTARRATTSIPMGAFPLDHAAKQEGFMVLREEGRAFARACSGRVLVLAEEPHFMMMSMMEADRSVRLTSFKERDLNVIRASGSHCTADFVEKQAPLRRDVVRDFLGSSGHAGWPIYFQEIRRNPYDRTKIPANRRFCSGVAADGCGRAQAPSG